MNSKKTIKSNETKAKQTQTKRQNKIVLDENNI